MRESYLNIPNHYMGYHLLRLLGCYPLVILYVGELLILFTYHERGVYINLLEGGCIQVFFKEKLLNVSYFLEYDLD